MTDPEHADSPKTSLVVEPGADPRVSVHAFPVARILVTDDRPEICELMDQALGARYECKFAGSLEEASKSLACGGFQLVIVSLHSTNVATRDLAHKLISDYPRMATVVLLTGSDDPKTAQEAFDLGVYAYLVEPFWPGQLMITVMNALRRRELELKVAAHVEDVEDRRQAIIDMAPMAIYAKDLSRSLHSR